MDSKEYAAAMAVLELFKSNQEFDQKMATMEAASIQEQERYNRNLKDTKLRQEKVDKRTEDNALYSSLNQRVGQVDKNWTTQSLTDLQTDITAAKNDLNKSDSHYDEFEIMYSSLDNLLANKISHNKEIWDANNQYNDFELKILNIHNAKNPQELDTQLQTLLNMEKTIIKDHRDNLDAVYRTQFNKYVTTQMPRIKSMIDVFKSIDSDATDDAFTPDIKDFSNFETTVTTTSMQTGLPQTFNIVKNADEARLMMVQACNYFQNGDSLLNSNCR